MILNSSGSTVTTVGDIQENQISIDAKNLEHVISILSTNLYSKPEQSFLREIVCNAIDAQVEANSEEPAIISMAYEASSGKYIISIRDYGTGISPERFKEIYLNIGSSTKRESNDYIGSFGIGRFSALACADMVHVTSYYKGTEYHYVMLKNGTKINVDLLEKRATEEHNGVEVKIKVSSLHEYRAALRYLWFVPNVFVNDTSNTSSGWNPNAHISQEFNERKLFKYNTFAYNNTSCDETFVLLGNILYPVNAECIPYAYQRTGDYREVWRKVIPTFSIGELDITPNREQLLYSDKTKKALEKRYKEVADELIDYCNKVSAKEYTNIVDYYKATTLSYIPLLLGDNASESPTILVAEDSFLRPYIHYKYRGGDPLAEDKDIRRTIGNFCRSYPSDVFNSLLVFEDTDFYTQKQLSGNSRNKRTGWFDMSRCFSNDMDVRIIFVPTLQGLRSDIFKQYLTEKSEGKTKRTLFAFTTDPTKISKFVNKPILKVTASADSKSVNWHKTLWLTRELKRSLSGNVYVYDVAKSKDFTDYRNEILAIRKEERKNRVQKFSSSTRFYIERCTHRIDAETHNLDSVKQLLALTTSKNIPVYWESMSSPYVAIWRSMVQGHQKCIIVTTAKTNLKYLEKAELPSHWRRITPELIQDSRLFRKWMTRKRYKVYKNPYVDGLMELSMPQEEVKAIDKLYNISFYSRDIIEDFAELRELENTFKGYYDQNMLAAYATIEKYNQLVNSLSNIIKLDSRSAYNYNISSLGIYVAMKRKMFRPNWDTYQNIVQTLNYKEKENEETN